MELTEELKSKIEKLLENSKILLFMKGDKFLPQCGFSAKVVEILNDHKIEFTSYDILEDPEVRSGLKIFSKWPTFPQLYINGELIGGCDIIMEMHETGELKDLIKKS